VAGLSSSPQSFALGISDHVAGPELPLLLTRLPILVCFAGILLLGIYIPRPLAGMLHNAASYLEVRP